MHGSLNKSDSEIETVGLATETPPMQNVLRQNRRMFSLRRLAKQRCWRPKSSKTATQLMARMSELVVLELGSEDTDEQSQL